MNKLIHAFAVALRDCLCCRGIVQMIAISPTIKPVIFNVFGCSLKKRNDAISGIKSDSLCAISVRTIPDNRTDLAKTINKTGNSKPSSRYHDKGSLLTVFKCGLRNSQAKSMAIE